MFCFPKLNEDCSSRVASIKKQRASILQQYYPTTDLSGRLLVLQHVLLVIALASRVEVVERDVADLENHLAIILGLNVRQGAEHVDAVR